MRYQILNKTRRISIFLTLFSLILLASCKHEDLDVYVESENYRNAADFVGNNYDLSLFHAGLAQSGLLEELAGEGPFTLFAPTNQAFNEIGIVRAFDFANMDQDSLRFMMQYHILPQRLYRDDVPDNTIDNLYENLVGKELAIAYRSGRNPNCPTCNVPYDFSVNGAIAPKLTQNVVLANGVLHALDKVLKYNPGTVQDVLENQHTFSLFVQLLKHFGEWDRLAEAGPWTIFAPTNTAFEARGLTEAGISAMTQTEYDELFLLRPYSLRNHLFSTDALFTGFLPNNEYGRQVYMYTDIEGDDDNVVGLINYLDQSNFQYHYSAFVWQKNPPGLSTDYQRYASLGDNWQRDYKAENGVVHAVTDLLAYPEDARK